MRAAIVRCLALLGVALGLLAAPWEGWGDVPMWQRRDVTPAFVAMQRAPFWEPRDGAGEQLAYTLRVALSSQRLVDVRGAAKQLAAISAPSPSVRLKLGEAYFRTAQFAACHTILATLPSAEGGRLVAREAEGALMMHAQCLARDGQPEAALALLQRAMRRGDETANGWFLIGESLALLGRWRQAHEAFARSHQLQRSGSAAWAVAVFAELAAGQIEGEKAALAALSVDSRLTGWRRAYLGTAQTEVPTIAVPYEHLVQAIMYRTIESYAESLSMTRVALHALEATPPAAPIMRDLRQRLAAIAAFVTPLAARGDIRATGLTVAQAEAIVTPHLSALRKCTLATPMVVYEVKIASGGTTARAAISFNAKTEQLGAGTDCLAAAAKTIRLPTITPPGPTGATTTPTRLPVHRSGVILPGGIRPVEIVFKVISL